MSFAVALAESFSGYKKTAKDEGDAANRWRNIAMGSFIAAALWTLFKVGAYWKGWVSTTPGNFDWAEVIAATSLTLILLGTAAYAAAQSKLHRVSEQQMSWFSLEIGALDPFIASLTEDQQRVLKIQLSQRLFGQNRIAAASEVDAGENGVVKTLLDAVTKLGGVRRQGFWHQWQLKLRESSAHLVGLIMRRVVCDASVAFRVSFV